MYDYNYSLMADGTKEITKSNLFLICKKTSNI